MKNRKREIVIMIIVVSIGLALLWLVGKINQEQKNLIEKEGVETVGTVIQKSYGADNTGKRYHIKFDFWVEDTLILGHKEFYNANDFDKAIVGMKYKVKYLKENPAKLKNSDIYMDKPILEEFENIGHERKRIRKDYVNGLKETN
jgi:hypothetical protein